MRRGYWPAAQARSALDNRVGSGMLGDERERLGYPSAHDQCVRVSVRLWWEGLAPPADTLGTKRSLAGTFHPQEAGGTAYAVWLWLARVRHTVRRGRCRSRAYSLREEIAA